MNNELYHHGVVGMKWGVRRYQNKDGTLTAAGKKKAKKIESQYYKVTGRKIVAPSEKTNSQKTSSNNSSEKTLYDIQKENTYLRAQKENLLLKQDIQKLTTPKNVNNGKNFTNKFLKESGSVLATSAKKAATAYLTSYFMKKLGVKQTAKRTKKQG